MQDLIIFRRIGTIHNRQTWYPMVSGKVSMSPEGWEKVKGTAQFVYYQMKGETYPESPIQGGWAVDASLLPYASSEALETALKIGDVELR